MGVASLAVTSRPAATPTCPLVIAHQSRPLVARWIETSCACLDDVILLRPCAGEVLLRGLQRSRLEGGRAQG
jgi:hypothetical protein